MRRTHRIVLVIASAILSAVCLPQQTCAERVREPVWAGKFYPGTRSELEKTLADLTTRARRSTVDLPVDKPLRALILPHAGYIYSGWTAAHAAHALTGRQYAKVVLIGPDHRVGFPNGAVSDAGAWKTPLGTTRIHADARTLSEGSRRFRSIPASDASEHSLEVVLPFLQYYLGEFELVPIVLGPGDVSGVASDIDAMLDAQTLLAVSTDLSHYLPYETAVARDLETIDAIMALAVEKLVDRTNCACGLMPILVTLDLARKHGWQPAMIHYSNSGDTAGDKDRVVGYTAIGFYGDTMSDKQNAPERVGETKGQALVRLARRTIKEKLGQNPEQDAAESRLLADPFFDTRLGTFVTLKIGGQLRGCIGSLTATESIRDGVRNNAVNAAFHDPRFPPLSDAELDRVDIEVSILTEPKPLHYRDHQDLLRKLRVDVDGVIIEKGRARATFLPQVWQQLPRAEAFLAQLCMKARLPADAWKHPGLDVFTYQVQYFEEQR